MSAFQWVLRRSYYLGVLALGVAVVVGPALAVAAPSPHSPAHHTYTNPQPPSRADFTGHGANRHGAYDSTRHGAPSMNGNGKGTAVGKPCAGCVGKADNKNPKGQMPNGSDPNAGYECDRNHGIGRTNPAHTGCVTASSGPPPGHSCTPPSGSGSCSPPPGHSCTPPPGGGSCSPPPGHSVGSPHTGSTVSQPRELGTSGAHVASNSATAPSSNLASTGVPIGSLAAAAAALIIIGGTLLLAGLRWVANKY